MPGHFPGIDATEQPIVISPDDLRRENEVLRELGVCTVLRRRLLGLAISSAALTALDLLRYPQASGGIDSVATALSDLGQKIDSEQLGRLSALVERPVVQRLGHLLEHLGHDARTGPMLGSLRARGSLPWTELDRREVRGPDFEPEPRRRDPRWRVIVRRVPEPDE